MSSNELWRFNEQFPNSKYREIYPQYTGSIDTDADKNTYQNSKRPINTAIRTFDEIKDTKNRIGWIVPKEYIVVDIDDKTSARIVFDILQATKIKFSFMTGRKGGHFIFKNTRDIQSISSHQACSLGLCIDIRANEKGYIILPENDTDRKWGNITSDIDGIPFFLMPLKSFKIQTDLIGLDAGEGRNDALLKHMLALVDYAKELTIDEKCESIRLINRYLFKTPISDIELQNTVLRDDILKKDISNQEEGGCYEEKLANRIIRDKNIITCNDICYMYNGKYYKRVEDITELERLIHLEYDSKLKSNRRQEVVKFVKLKSYVNCNELNKKWNEIVFKNGVLDLATMTLNPHTPSVYNTIYIDCNYIPDAPYSQLIDDFFNQISTKEIDKKTLLYEIVGYCLIRKNVFEKFFVCYGEGATGKSTYLNLIRNLIGDNNCSFLSLNDLENDFMPANLFGKLVNIGDDIPYKGLKETAILKKLVTGEKFAAQQKYLQQPLNFSNFAKLIFTTNRLPEVYDRTSGFYRRILIIDINKKIENPDPFFLSRLNDSDYEYLLSVAVKKLVNALQVNKLTDCVSSMAKLEQYRTEQSSVLSFAAQVGYTRLKLDHKPCMEVYNEYLEYCSQTGFKPLKKPKFDIEICEEFKMHKRNTTRKEEGNKSQCWRFV